MEYAQSRIIIRKFRIPPCTENVLAHHTLFRIPKIMLDVQVIVIFKKQYTRPICPHVCSIYVYSSLENN